MNDIFNEQLVKREKTTKDLVMKVLIFVIGGVLLLAALSIQSLAVIFLPLLIVVGVAIYYFLRRLNVEYEYILTNNELDIDIIYNMSKRKRLLSVDIKTFDLMASVKEYPNEINNFDKELNYSSGVVKDNTYAIACNINGNKTKLIIEPNENLFKGMKTYIPHKIKK